MKNYCLILFIVGCITGCDPIQYQLTPSVVGYPMKVGTKWTYDRQVIISKFESASSDHVVAVDTLNTELFVWIDNDTVLNKQTVKVFKSREVNGSFLSCWFLLSNKEGVKICANQNVGKNVWEHHGPQLKLSIVPPAYSDTVHSIIPPMLDLKLPLLQNTRWIYKYPTKKDTFQIEKAVTGTEVMTLTGMKINCYKLEWICTRDSLLNGFNTTEWYSDKGLMKKKTTVDRITFTDENNKTLYEGRYLETLTLKSFRYK